MARSARSGIRLRPLHDQRAMRGSEKDNDPCWGLERERLFIEEERMAFDPIAPKLTHRCKEDRRTES